MANPQMFAVAVRDGKDLFLWVRIRRNPTGEIFAIISNEQRWKVWDPHFSFHADGEIHYKSFEKIDRDGNPRYCEQGQSPDVNFAGIRSFHSTDIRADDVKYVGLVCDPHKFDEVMEVEATKLWPTNPHDTYVSIYFTEPNVGPPLVPGREIITRKVFKDSIPWIHVTICENRV
jgi:hypothetical protein